MDQPDTGQVTIAGQETTTLKEQGLTRLRADTIGFVFQQFFLQPTLTARENVLLPTLFARQKHLASRADELLARVGLAERANHLPDELSGGEMQRVAIARALINKPKVLLADEPTGNLDSQNARAIFALLDELHDDGLTLITVTHSEALTSRAERRIHLLDGRISDD
jgi:putative ABC transport system ATP-binding protein